MNARASGGRITHLHVGTTPGGRIVENDGILFVGWKSEHDGLRHYLAAMPDGRSARAARSTLVEAQRAVCDELGIPRRQVIGGED